MIIRNLAVAIISIVCLASAAPAADNCLTEQEKEAGWQLLFNGKDHTGWRCNNGKLVATPIDQSSLLPYKSGGYLILHEKEFGDFLLKCDVKWDAAKCNSGIFFRVEDRENPVHTGLEMQVQSGKNTGKHEFGAIYDLAACSENAGKPTGQWNQVEIECRGPKIQVRLNGRDVCAMNCDDFAKPGYCPDGQKHKYELNGKPRAVKDFARKGYLGFQDHGQKVWYKNVKLLELK
jgi:3-keto-disaccharide hydrolase